MPQTCQRWTKAHGYFELARFGQISRQRTDRTVREARELREARDVFLDDCDERMDDLIEQWEPHEYGELEVQGPVPIDAGASKRTYHEGEGGHYEPR